MGFNTTRAIGAGLVLLWSAEAQAICTPPAAGNPPQVTCTGATADQDAPSGYGSPAINGSVITVVPGASVTGTNEGFLFTSATVLNSGAVTGGQRGIFAVDANVTNSGTITGGNSGIRVVNSATVTNSGSITGTAVAGILADVNASVINSGTVSGGANGIFTTTASITNSGTIAGGTNSAIVAQSTANVTNSGTIIGGTFGINTDTAIVTNTGTIAGTTSSGIGAVLAATVVNSGAISGQNGIFSLASLDLMNSGTITGQLTGISAATVNITNAGLISGTNAGVLISSSGTVNNAGRISGDVGFASGTNANLTNSGTIIGTGGTAIFFNFAIAGGIDTLTLLPGSRIIGAIDMGGGADVVNVRSGPDVSWLVTLSNFTGTINGSGNVPFVISGNQIATLDPTAFAMADRVLGDFTRGVSGVIAGRASEGGTAGAPLALAPPDGLATWYGEMFEAMAYAGAPVFKAPTQVSREGTAVWARAFGGHRDHDGDDATLPAISTFGGGAVGIDTPVAHGIRLGAFVGGGATRLNIAASSGGTDTDVLFGGVYGGWRSGSFFVGGALHGGHLDNRGTRRIANNLAPGGFETATASYDGWYVSPELGAGYRFALAPEWSLTPAARVRYMHADLDGYVETGSAANLTVAGRTLENLEERFDLTLSRRQAFATGDTLTTSIHAGVLGLHRLGGDTVNTVLLGVNLPFATPGEDNVAGLYAGAAFEWRLKPNVAFFGAGEAIAMSDDSTVIHGKGGLRVAF